MVLSCINYISNFPPNRYLKNVSEKLMQHGNIQNRDVKVVTKISAVLPLSIGKARQSMWQPLNQNLKSRYFSLSYLLAKEIPHVDNISYITTDFDNELNFSA